MAGSLDVSPQCAVLLDAAAVIGPSFEVDLLALVTEREPLECLDVLAEAAAAGIVESESGPDRYRFVDPTESEERARLLTASERVRLHAAIAEAIGSLHGERLDAHLFELAAHWSAAAVGDFREPAAAWIARAADRAAEQRDFDAAARMYRRSLEIGSSSVEPAARCAMLLGLAESSYRCSDVVPALAACEDLAATARAADRVDLLARAALVVEPTLSPDLNSRLRRLCVDALAHLPDREVDLRIRVAARLADVCHYLGDLGAAHEVCVELADAVGAGTDPATQAVALHALQLDNSGPTGVDTRAHLADQLADAASQMGDPVELTWAWLWRTDVALQHGDLGAAARAVQSARQSADEANDVVTRWHVLRAEATLAQAQARFDDALRLAGSAATLLADTGNPLGQVIWAAQVTNVQHHIGFDDALARALGVSDDSPFDPTATVGAIQTLSRVMVQRAHGRVVEAAAAYRSLGPVAGWHVQPHSELLTLVYGVLAATSLDERADVAALYSRLEPFRGQHIVSGAGCIAYFGPAELWLGLAAGYLGDHAHAVDDLEHAMQSSLANGSAGFAVEAQLALARVLVSRSGPGDARRARELATHVAERAGLLGMNRVRAEAHDLLAATPAAALDGLTTREREVAGLVAEGMSNRAIASRLYLSERTAANHVQHILDKLGLANRSQIAVWVLGVTGRETR